MDGGVVGILDRVKVNKLFCNRPELLRRAVGVESGASHICRPKRDAEAPNKVAVAVAVRVTLHW